MDTNPLEQPISLTLCRPPRRLMEHVAMIGAPVGEFHGRCRSVTFRQGPSTYPSQQGTERSMCSPLPTAPLVRHWAAHNRRGGTGDSGDGLDTVFERTWRLPSGSVGGSTKLGKRPVPRRRFFPESGYFMEEDVVEGKEDKDKYGNVRRAGRQGEEATRNSRRWTLSCWACYSSCSL